MEIERKYLVTTPPKLDSAVAVKKIEQGYVSTSPVIRIRRANDAYFLTCKGQGLMAREEFELGISVADYEHLRTKLDTPLITKTRYLFSLPPYTVEMDIFEGALAGLILAEVEFPTQKEADGFTPPAWFGKDVTMDRRFQNSHLSTLKDLSSLPVTVI